MSRTTNAARILKQLDNGPMKLSEIRKITKKSTKPLKMLLRNGAAIQYTAINPDYGTRGQPVMCLWWKRGKGEPSTGRKPDPESKLIKDAIRKLQALGFTVIPPTNMKGIQE